MLAPTDFMRPRAAIDPDGAVEGYASLFGEADHALWIGNPEVINGWAALSGILMTYMAARFGVLGVYVGGRSREKQALATGDTVPSIAAELVKALSKRK